MDAAPSTLQGVRDGEAAALRGLVCEHGPAVMAYCTEVCGDDAASRAAAEAFARLRAALQDATDLDGFATEELLRGGTRHAAASMARVPGTAHGARLHRRDTANCPRIPALLAARAGGLLGDADEERLSRHLAHCERCRAVEAAFARAERAYDAPRAQGLAPATENFLVAALGAAAPIVATAQDPEPGNRSQPAALPLTAGVQDADDHDEPAPSVAAGTADDTLGETMEWDALPAIPARPAPRVAHAGSVLEGGRERSARGGGGGRVLRLVLPVIVVLAGGVGALVVAGVFGGNDPAPPVQRDTSSRDLERPVTTPLPVEVRTTATPQDGLVTAPLQP